MLYNKYLCFIKDSLMEFIDICLVQYFTCDFIRITQVKSSDPSDLKRDQTMQS